MIGQEGYGIQRRALDVEDYIDIARRHKSWIFGPAFAALVIAVVVAYLWPDTYISTATIKVVPQTLPTNFVEPNVNQRMQDRITSLASSIVSRNVLSSLITTNQLYQRELSRKPMDDVVEKMRDDIAIGQVTAAARLGNFGDNKTIPAFQVSFSYTDRYKAQRVVQELASRFVDQNLRDRSSASFQTSQFLADNRAAARKALEEAESKLASFRSRNQGRLPDQMQSNLQQLSAVQARLTTLNEGLSRSNQERMMLEGLLRIYKDELAAGTKEPGAQRGVAIRKSEKVADADREIRQLEDLLARQRERYRDNHPDVQQTMGLLAAAKRKREQALKEDDSKPAEDEQPVGPSPSDLKEARALEQNVKRIEMQINAKNLEAEDIRKEIANVNGIMKSFESRLQGIPLSEKEYSDLMRERDIAREKFLEMDEKFTKSNIAQQMEDRQQGETLQLLDSASLPMTPDKPNRLMIIGAGLALGLGLGVAVAGAREVKDTSLKNLKDVRAYTQMAVLGSIPLLENDLVIKRRRRLAWLGWSLAFLAGIAIMSGSVIFYYTTKV